MSEKIKVSVIGASGFTGRELLRLLSKHEKVKLDILFSRTYAGRDIADIHPSLKGIISKTVSDDIPQSNDVVFLALPHTKSLKFVPQLIKNNRLVIDLSADYRFKDIENYKKWYGIEHGDEENLKKAVYGIPEINRNEIKNAALIANPGCYATAVILSVYPLLKEGMINSTVYVDAKSGISGAGKKLDSEYLFTKRYENITPYKVNSHRHMGEIMEFLNEKKINLVFCPHLIPVNRGILSNTYTKINKNLNIEDIRNIFLKYYENEHFINICNPDVFPEISEVNFTNNCNIGISFNHETGDIVVISAIDNLIKGASGQAVQNMNIVLGFEETSGLT